MIIWPALGLMLFAFMLVYRYKREKAIIYHLEQSRLDAAREEAIRDGNIFTRRDQRIVEDHLKISHPHLNRHQRKERAVKTGELFVQRVKAGLE